MVTINFRLFSKGFQQLLSLVVVLSLTLVATFGQATFGPTVVVTLDGLPPGSPVELGSKPVLGRVTTYFAADDLPSTRELEATGVTVDWSLLPAGTKAIGVDLTVFATLFSRVAIGTAKLTYSVTANSGSSVELESVIDEVTLTAQAQALLTEEQKQQISAFVGYLASVGSMSATASGFALEETYNIPDGTQVSPEVVGLNVSIELIDTFLADAVMITDAAGPTTLAADPAQGDPISFTSILTSLNEGLTAGPIINEFVLAGADVFKAYLPMFLIPDGDLYGIALSNATETEANVEVTAYGKLGSVGAYSMNPRQTVVPSQTQFVGAAREVLGIPADDFPEGWIELHSDNSLLGGFSLFGDNNSMRLDGASAVEELSQKLYLTRIFDGAGQFQGQDAKTTLSMANPNDEAVAVRLRLVGEAPTPSGYGPTNAVQPIAQVTRLIPARGALVQGIGELFGQASVTGYVILEVLEGGGVVAAQRVALDNIETVFVLNGAVASTSTALYSAQLATIPNVLFTSVKMINTLDVATTVTVTAVDGLGQNFAPPTEVVLGPGEFLEQEASELFPDNGTQSLGRFPAQQQLVGSLKVDAPDGGVIADVVFGTTNLSYAAALPLLGQTFTKAVFSHVANISGFFFTGLALFNPGPVAATATVDIYTADGTLAQSIDVPLPAGGRISDTLANLAPLTIGQNGGFIVISCDQAIVAQELFGRNDLGLIAAVFPKVLE